MGFVIGNGELRLGIRIRDWDLYWRWRFKVGDLKVEIKIGKWDWRWGLVIGN